MSDWLRMHRVFVPALASLFVVGCGGGEGGAPAGGGETAVVESPVDPATAGSISGSVSFSGDAPAMETIDMSTEADCAAKYTEPPTTQGVVVNDNGTLANVFVYVKEGLGDMTFPTPSESVLLDQDGCRYLPHIVGLQTGQTLRIHNSDGLLHNINATPSENRGFNISQPVEMDSERDFPVAEVMIPVRCDVHGWMESFIGVLEHPYHSVSGGDGSFSMANLPPGDYVIEAWHERYGTQTQNVTVPASGNAQVDFAFDASMGESAFVPMGEPLIIRHSTLGDADH